MSQFASQLVGGLTLLLAIFGFPFAFVFALLFRRQLLSSTRSGKLGLEDVLRNLFGISWICGLIVAALAVLATVLAR